MMLDTTEIAVEPASVEPELSVRRTTQQPPGWLYLVALATAAAVLSFGLVGLVLAINGWYSPALAFSLGTVAWIGVLVLARPAIAGRRPRTAGAHFVAVIGIAAILAITAWNSAHTSEHVVLNRDGGAYAATGRWVARTGTLDVKPAAGPLATAHALSFSSAAVYREPNGSLQFQFAHLLPVVLAEAYAIDGDRGLFHAPALLGGVALLAFFVLAWRVLRRPWFALAAMLALAFLIPQVSFTRDSYSEIPSQILLFTALWLLVSKAVLPRWRLAFTAGLFLGATQAVRIDAMVFMIGVPVAIAYAWLRAPRDERRRTVLPSIGAFLAGLVPGLTIGLIDLVRHSGDYFADLWSNTRSLLVLVVLSVIGSALLVAGWEWRARKLRRTSGRAAPTFDVDAPAWNAFTWVAAVTVLVVGFGAWILRPRHQTVRAAPQAIVASLQFAEHQAVDAGRAYYEYSMTWMSWYLGPLTLIAAIIGGALLVRALLKGRMYRLAAALAVIVPGSLLYLYEASAVSDQVWVTRRFLVGSFPTLILLGVGLAAFGWGTRRSGWKRAAIRGVSVVVAVGAVAFPIHTIRPVAAMQEKRNFLQVVYGVCDDIGPNAVVILLRGDEQDFTDQWLPQTLRSWCGAQVAAVHDSSTGQHFAVDPDEVRELAQQYQTRGQKVFLVANSPVTITSLLPEARPLPARTVFDRKELARTLTHRPNTYMIEKYSVTVAQVRPG